MRIIKTEKYISKAIAEMTGVHRNFVNDYFRYMEKTGLITQLKSDIEGVWVLVKTELLWTFGFNYYKKSHKGEVHKPNP
jgi:hypothetical protein